MSDNTPESLEMDASPSGVGYAETDEADASMEDILVSIRKMIAEDQGLDGQAGAGTDAISLLPNDHDGVAEIDTDLDIPDLPDTDVVPTAPASTGISSTGTLAEPEPDDFLDLDLLLTDFDTPPERDVSDADEHADAPVAPTDVDALLADLGTFDQTNTEISGSSATSPTVPSFGEADGDASDTLTPDTGTSLSADDFDIDLLADAPVSGEAASGVDQALDMPISDLDASSVPLELDPTPEDAAFAALIDSTDLVETDDSPVTSADLDFETLQVPEPVPAAVGATEDMDLVRSLMADLTDPDAEVETAEDATTSIFDDSAIVDEILDLNVEDALAIPDIEDAVDDIPDLPRSSGLSAIADRAKARAERVEGLGIVAASGVALAAQASDPDHRSSEDSRSDSLEDNVVADASNPDVAGEAVAVSTDDLDASETAVSDLDPTSHLDPISPAPSQEPAMPAPKASNISPITSEAADSDASAAFASLNQLVEEKSVYEERGPRIGDLVQEALRPMLREWLDANLKGIVERAVTKEVKRISSGK